jgi:hypothetical protein
VPTLGNLLIGASLLALAVMMAGSLDSARIAAGPEARLFIPLDRSARRSDWQRGLAPARAGAAAEQAGVVPRIASGKIARIPGAAGALSDTSY